VHPTSNPSVLARWNTLPPAEAAESILPCCGSHLWAETLATHRPIDDANQLLHLSDEIWQSLPPEAWQQAFDSHPRLGERHAKAATSTSLTWSSQEQSKAEPTEALRAANAGYEARFGRIFLLCANGRTAPEILSALESRIHNDPETEWHESGEQQRQITQLRLKRWLGGT
jgi:2-oxo-4-hydroxy-4-carboxy-5-ureidoimidazoline decarboxylase